MRKYLVEWTYDVRIKPVEVVKETEKSFFTKDQWKSERRNNKDVVGQKLCDTFDEARECATHKLSIKIANTESNLVRLRSTLKELLICKEPV